METQNIENEELILDPIRDQEFIEKWGIRYDIDPAWDVKDEDVLDSKDAGC